MRGLFRSGVLLVAGLLLWGCSSPKITPLSEPVFRLDSTQKAVDCEQNKTVACTWTLKGAIDQVAVVGEGDNPFQNCQNCTFNQKFSLTDQAGTRHFLYYRLPTEEAASITLGTNVEMFYVDAQNIGRGYALSVREQGGRLLFAVASGAGGHFLKANHLSPLTLQDESGVEVGREVSECGTRIFRPLRFQVGAQSARVSPGETKTLQDKDVSYRVANVNRFSREGSQGCANLTEPSFAFFALLRPAG